MFALGVGFRFLNLVLTDKDDCGPQSFALNMSVYLITGVVTLEAWDLQQVYLQHRLPSKLVRYALAMQFLLLSPVLVEFLFEDLATTDGACVPHSEIAEVLSTIVLGLWVVFTVYWIVICLLLVRIKAPVLNYQVSALALTFPFYLFTAYLEAQAFTPGDHPGIRAGAALFMQLLFWVWYSGPFWWSLLGCYINLFNYGSSYAPNGPELLHAVAFAWVDSKSIVDAYTKSSAHGLPIANGDFFQATLYRDAQVNWIPRMVMTLWIINTFCRSASKTSLRASTLSSLVSPRTLSSLMSVNFFRSAQEEVLSIMYAAIHPRVAKSKDSFLIREEAAKFVGMLRGPRNQRNMFNPNVQPIESPRSSDVSENDAPSENLLTKSLIDKNIHTDSQQQASEKEELLRNRRSLNMTPLTGLKTLSNMNTRSSNMDATPIVKKGTAFNAPYLLTDPTTTCDFKLPLPLYHYAPPCRDTLDLPTFDPEKIRREVFCALVKPFSPTGKACCLSLKQDSSTIPPTH